MYDKRKVVCLTVALPHQIHYALRDFCERVSDEEMRPITQAEIARLCIVRFLRAKGVRVTLPSPPARTINRRTAGAPIACR